MTGTAGPPASLPGPASPPGAGLPAGFAATGPPLGAGATAVVWPVRRLPDGREFALKVWRQPFATAGQRERFRREVRQHIALNDVSGHIVTYSWAEEDPAEGTPWIGTERHGGSLQQLLEGGRPPLAAALVLCGDLLAGLAAMHGLGTLHRDVKPGNVLVDEGRAKLCDLGLVMGSADHTADNAAGSPRYVAPELLRGSARPSPRTDVYSAAQTIRQVVGSALSEPLEQLVTEAGSVDPDDRPRDAVELHTRFRQACAVLGHRLPDPLSAREAERRGGLAATPRGRSRQLVVTAGVGALVLLATGGALALATDPDPDRPPRRSSPTAAATVPDAGPAPTAVTVDGSPVPDAGLAPPDVTADGAPVLRTITTPGKCEAILPDATHTGDTPYANGDGTTVAEVWSYYSRVEHQACAKLVKPNGSPFVGIKTHLAFTLCGDANSCDHDWQSYPVDAGPLVVPSRDGCVSWRVSMLDGTGEDWIVRDAVQSFGCS